MTGSDGHRRLDTGDAPKQLIRIWPRVKMILSNALDLPTQDRSDYVQKACGADRFLRDNVESLLLENDRISDGFLDSAPLPPLKSTSDTSGDLIDSQIASFRLTEVLGIGGMGAVYGAERVGGDFTQSVAIKLLQPGCANSDFHRRFAAERKILASLEHPSIARLIDGGSTESGIPYIILERVDGIPIDRYCSSHRLDLRDRLRLFRDVCKAVSFAHQNLVIHRDLKPANILTTETGAPKLLDFGIAKLIESDAEVTAPGMTPMTLKYASPEQIAGGPISTATDVYSLGIILYELLTDQHPFDAKHQLSLPRDRTPQAPSQAVKRKPPSSDRPETPKQLSRQLAGDLDLIVARALAPQLSERFNSVEQLESELQRFLAGRPLESRPDRLWYSALKFTKREPAFVIASLVATFLLFAFVLTTTFQNSRLSKLTQQLTTERDRSDEATELLVSALRLADPSRSKGRDMTVLEALEQAHERLEQNSTHPLTKASILDAIGRVYSSHGKYEVALPVLEEALSLRRAHLGSEDDMIAASLQNLATVLRARGQIAEAETNLRQAESIRRRSNPEGDLGLATNLNDLASLMARQGRLLEARELASEGLHLKRSLGSSDLDISISANTMATILSRLEDFATAELLYQEVIQTRRKDDLGSQHLAHALNNLAVLQMDHLGKAEEALTAFEESLVIRKRIFGENHPKLAVLLSNMSLALIETGEPEEAEQMLERARSILIDTKGSDPLHLAFIDKHRALVAGILGRPSQCQELTNQVIAIFERKGISTHRADAVSIRAGCLMELSRMPEAEESLKSSFLELHHLKGSNHRQTRQALERVERHLGTETAQRLVADAKARIAQ